ncbi:MAG: flagellar export protein FliJ [Vampirovibrionia bacterium]
MSPFVYRLEKVLKYRINKKEEQLQVVKAAQREVQRIQGEIDKNNATIISLRQSMYQADHTLLQSYDNYIKHLYGVIDKLELDKINAINRLEEEKRILEELDKSIKALEKHKEKALEIYKQEQKEREMKKLNEIGSQKHFIKMLERQEEEYLEEMELEEEEEEL